MIAEHLFGVWGLLLAVPIAAFIMKYVIEGQPVAPAARVPRGAGSGSALRRRVTSL